MAAIRSRAAAKLGHTVTRLRERAGIPRKTLADRTGIDLSHVARIENGQTNTTLHALIQLATALDVAPAHLLDGITADDLPEGVRPFSEADYRRELRNREARA